MPKIEEYRQVTEPTLGRELRYVQAQGGRLFMNDGLSDLSRSLYQVAGAVKEKNEEDGRAWAAKAVSEARLKWTQHFVERQAQAEPGAPEFTPKLLADYDTYTTEALANAPTDSARRFLSQRFDEFKVQLGSNAITFEANARIDHRSDQLNEGTRNTAKLMNTDPSQYQAALAEQLAIIDSSGLPPIKKSALRENAISRVSQAAVWSQIQKSPTAFLQSIGFGTPEAGKTRKTSGDLTGLTGNTAFDALPHEQRIQLFSQAITLKAQIDADADAAAKAQKLQAADDAAKQGWNLIFSGKLRDAQTYIENTVRPLVGQATYHSMLVALDSKRKGDGSGASGPKTDPSVFRDLQLLIHQNKFDEAAQGAFTAHRNRQLSNEHLSLFTERARTQSRQEGPKSPYERATSYIVKSLDPGPYIKDPLGQARFAEASQAFDKWFNQNPNRPEEDVEKRAREIVGQYRFINLQDNALSLPMPRSGTIRRNPADKQGMLADIAKATNEAQRRFDSKRYTARELEDDLKIIKQWRDAVMSSQ